MKQSLNNFYVYLHKELDGTIFYVGKGNGTRAYSKSNRGLKWNNHIKSIGDYTVEIAYDNLTENDALDIEESLITEIGLSNLTNIMGRGYVMQRDYLKAQQSLNDFINLCNLHYTL
jgi:hypothetical protein